MFYSEEDRKITQFFVLIVILVFVIPPALGYAAQYLVWDIILADKFQSTLWPNTERIITAALVCIIAVTVVVKLISLTVNNAHADDAIPK